MSFWTKETVDELLRLWTGGYSAGDIAIQLGRGVTRNAVISKLHRLGKTDETREARSAPRAYVAREVKKAEVKKSRPLPTLRKEPPPPPPPPSRPSREDILSLMNDAPPTAVSFLKLKPRQCRWPYGDAPFRFCAEPVADRVVNAGSCPYCEAHAEIAYPTPPKKKSDNTVRKDFNLPRVTTRFAV